MTCNNGKEFKEYLLIRVELFIFSFLFIIFSLLIITNNPILILTRIGKNTLYIYLFHRIITIIIDKELFNENSEIYIILLSLIFSFIILFVFGSNFLSLIFNKFISFIHYNIQNMNIFGKKIGFIFIILFIYFLLLNSFLTIEQKKKIEMNKIENISLSIKLINNYDFEKAIKILYIGQLNILKEQIISSKNQLTGKYEFDEIFKYTSEYFKKSDLTIGIFDISPSEKISSPKNDEINDLIYTDEFIMAIKKAGINLLNTVSNHILDNRINDIFRSLDILDKYNIHHIGIYKNLNVKNEILIINIKGLKLAILSYISCVDNFYCEKLYEQHSYITNILPDITNKYYTKIYENIKNVFLKAKKSNSDFIIVLLNMENAHIQENSDFQEKWKKILSNFGADIILGFQPNGVKPLESIEKVFFVNCPGYFINSNIHNNEETSSIVELYFNKNSKKFIGSSIIPIYKQEIKPNYFLPIPSFKMINNSIFLSSFEKKRLNEINKLVTKIMIKREFSIKEGKERYYFINNSYYDICNKKSKISNLMKKKYKNKLINKLIDNSSSITFVGDNFIDGDSNIFIPWYEPLIYLYRNKKVISISKRNLTTQLFIRNFKYEMIKSKSDLYIITIGTNDIKFRDKNICAMTKEQYIKNINIIVQYLKMNNDNSKFIFISPVLFFQNDDNFRGEKKLQDEFSESLKKYSKKQNYLYINPNQYIQSFIKKNYTKYIINKLYFNEKEGIELYNEAILNNSE